MTRAALDAAHLGSARFPEVYESLTGEPLYTDGAICVTTDRRRLVPSFSR